jgi:Zn-finger nucleic acid-binding protein
MKCPVCDTYLRAAERAGVEIDYCPHCRGVWLEQGQLDQLLGRSNPLDWDCNRKPAANNLRRHGDVASW